MLMVLSYLNHLDSADFDQGAASNIPYAQSTRGSTAHSSVAQVIAMDNFNDISPHVFYPSPLRVPPGDPNEYLDDGFDAPLLRIMSSIPMWTSNGDWVAQDYESMNLDSRPTLFHG